MYFVIICLYITLPQLEAMYKNKEGKAKQTTMAKLIFSFLLMIIFTSVIQDVYVRDYNNDIKLAQKMHMYYLLSL